MVLGGGAVALVVWLRREGGDVEEEEGGGVVAPVSIGGDTTEIGSAGGLPIEVRLRQISDRHRLRIDAADAYNAMAQAAARDGLNLVVNSAFRSRAEQARLYAMYQAGTGNLAAPPGYSTHEGGLSADIDMKQQGRAAAAYVWLAANARRFGFVNDVASEPWHWTYKI